MKLLSDTPGHVLCQTSRRPLRSTTIPDFVQHSIWATDVWAAGYDPSASRTIITVVLLSQMPPTQGPVMTKPVIFTISAAWDDEASVWSGHCDDIPAAADAPTLDALLAKISAMALDVLPDNHPDVDPASLYLQISSPD